jgi:hypothetical protein
MKSSEQRAALFAMIQRRFPDARVECSDPPWLIVPKISKLTGPLKKIYDALRHDRGHTAFATERRRLVCDVVIPSRGLIVEYDERQHFTRSRGIALRLYPKDFELGFNPAYWMEHCDKIAATDNSPPYRDEQRAFYDSVRDLLAAAHGHQVIRIMHGECDWRDPTASAAQFGY